MRTLTVALSLVTLAGCDAGQFGEEEDLPCEEVARTAVAADAPLQIEGNDGPIEIVPSETFAEAEGSWSGALSWDVTGNVATIDASIEVDEALYELVDVEPVDGLDVRCADRLEATADVVVSTDDGRLDEAWTGPIRANSYGVFVDQVVEDPVGTVDPTAHVDRPDEIDPVAVRISLTVSQGEVGGAIHSVNAEDPEEDSQGIARW